ncbi:MAG TPA: hypothetical protein VGD67_18595, partial [Pseudonocardiaceae bacterium]
MLVLSVVVFGLAWWLGLYLLARDPAKPVLRHAGLGLLGYAAAVAAEALRPWVGGGALATAEVYLLCVPAVAWLAVLLALAVPDDDAPAGAGGAAE